MGDMRRAYEDDRGILWVTARSDERWDFSFSIKLSDGKLVGTRLHEGLTAGQVQRMADGILAALAPSSAPVDAPANRIDKPGRYVLTADFVNRGTISVGTLPAGTEIEITQVDADGGKVIGPRLADWTGWDRIPCRPSAPVDDARGGKETKA